MCIRQIKKKYPHINWKKAIISLLIGTVLVAVGGIPAALAVGFFGFLSWAAIVVALYGGWIAVSSLQLTRATQRPFLNVSRINALFHGDGVNPSPVRYFMIGIENMGNYPADQVVVTCNMWKIGDSEKHKLILQGKETPIYFPNEGNPNLMFAEVDDGNRLIVSVGEKLRVYIEIDYRNKLTDTQHKTIRSYSTEYNLTATHEPIPIPEEDYWE